MLSHCEEWEKRVILRWGRGRNLNDPTSSTRYRPFPVLILRGLWNGYWSKIFSYTVLPVITLYTTFKFFKSGPIFSFKTESHKIPNAVSQFPVFKLNLQPFTQSGEIILFFISNKPESDIVLLLCILCLHYVHNQKLIAISLTNPVSSFGQVVGEWEEHI